jgi:hypothetical protein
VAIISVLRRERPTQHSHLALRISQDPNVRLLPCFDSVRHIAPGALQWFSLERTVPATDKQPVAVGAELESVRQVENRRRAQGGLRQLRRGIRRPAAPFLTSLAPPALALPSSSARIRPKRFPTIAPVPGKRRVRRPPRGQLRGNRRKSAAAGNISQGRLISVDSRLVNEDQ